MSEKHGIYSGVVDIARNGVDELIRLRALNAELVEALKHAAECVQTNYLPDKMGHDWDDVIAKAEAKNGS